MRFRIRRDRAIRPLAYRENHAPLRAAPDDDEWNITRPLTATPLPASPPPPPSESANAAQLAPEGDASVSPPPPPPAPSLNGFRSQATVGDARAERLVREVRMELADLKQAMSGWNDDREDMVTVDLDSLRANPEAAAALPPATLVRALAEAADRIGALEREAITRDREEAALRERLAHLQEEYSYARGRLETLHEVVGALHGNLDDLRSDRERLRSAEPAIHPQSLRSPGTNEFGLRDQRGGFAP